jgi:hypothetical protein
MFLTSFAGAPDYDFRNPVLISGTALQLNAKYRFSNVKPGIDAIVQIAATSGGTSVDQIDGPTGYVEAFQPVIYAPGNSNGWVEFRINFVSSGTSNPVSMVSIPSTTLDVDGTLSSAGNLFEFDMVALGSATSVYNFDMSTTELTMNSSSGWVTGKNVTGNNYNGVDTSARKVMFTVINYNTNIIRIRVGAENKSATGTTRNKSIYFKNFIYTNSLLAKMPLINFSGVKKSESINLQWKIDQTTELQKVILEKSSGMSGFTAIADFNISANNRYGAIDYVYNDYAITDDKLSYRLKFIDAKGFATYGNALCFVNNIHETGNLTMNINYSAGNPALNIKSGETNEAMLQFRDLTGNVLSSRKISLVKGMNAIALPSGKVQHGYHIAVLMVNNRLYATRFLQP